MGMMAVSSADKELAFVELLDATESYMEATQQLSQAVRKGLFHISQARYSYHAPLGQTQYHMEMEASTTVTGRDASEFQLASTLSVVAGPTAANQRPAGPATVAADPQPAAQAAPANSSSGSQAVQCCPSGQDEVSSSATGDPLRWFGVLVPPTLRAAQQDFIQALRDCVQLAAAKHRLQQALDQASAAKVADVAEGVACMAAS